MDFEYEQLQQTSLEGSGDSIGKKQRKMELELEPVSNVSTVDLSQFESLGPNTPESAKWITDNIQSLLSAFPELATSVQALKDHVEKTKTDIESWIKKAFEVDDLEQQIYLLNAKRRFSELSVDESERPGKQTRTVSSEDKPKLRLKLNSEQQETQQQQQQQQPGRGSKNLGRMARPQPEAPELKPKIPNQIPIGTFWNFVEQFFKRLDENDLKYLDDPAKIVDPIPFTIPQLGRPYLEQWRESYGYIGGGSGSYVGHRQLPPVTRAVSLKERLMSMLIEENQVDIEEFESEDQFMDDLFTEQPSELEERLRRDLAESGFIDLKLAGKDYQEDDEICAELRRLQSQLRLQTMLNQYRKKRLADYCRKHILPAQELYALVDEIDKQLVSVYQRAVKANKKRSSSAAKKTESSSVNYHQEAARLIANREKLLESFGPCVGPRKEYLEPSESNIMKLFDDKVEEKLKKDARETGAWFLQEQ